MLANRMSATTVYFSHEEEKSYLLNLINPYVRDDEKLVAVIKGGLSIAIQIIPDILIITDKNVMILKRKWSSLKLHSVSIENITEIQTENKNVNIFTRTKQAFYFFPIYHHKDVETVKILIDQQLKRIKPEPHDVKKNEIQSEIDNLQTEMNRIERLEKIVKRTQELKIEDMQELFQFSSRAALLDWLYSLPERFALSVKGEVVTFETSTNAKVTLISEEKERIFCFYCDAELQENEDGSAACLNCGEEMPHCEICKKIIVKGEKIVQIHECNHIFHKLHIVEWINAHGSCPICKTRINEESLRPV